MLETIVSNAPLFLLVAVRCFTLIMTIPLFSSRAVSRKAKLALTAYMAYFIFPQISTTTGPYSEYVPFISQTGNFSIEYIFLLLGEGMIGIIIGFYISIIFAAFSTAGQFFAFQMGFSASQVYDALSQVENPLMGQYFNLIAMLVFLQNAWFQKLFLGGLTSSFQALNAFSIINNSDKLLTFMMSSLTILFKDALIISIPIMGTLFLINVAMGILTKAAPQMNLMSEGFALMILASFFIILSLLPIFAKYFSTCFTDGFKQLQILFTKISSGGIT